MITIFTIPKAFRGHINIIQRNAIQSWTCLRPECEIILCGDDPGVREIGAEFGLTNIPDIDRNEFGTPLLSSAFEKVKKAASTDLLCYVNSDIIFLSDFVPSVKRINTDRFLLLGNRWNIDVNEPIDFADNSWERRLRERVKSNGSLQPPLGADYFVLKKNEALSDIPPFAVGRPFWDLWFIYNARKNKYKVIDASQAITVLHQNHDYAHLRRDYCRNQSEDFNWGRADGPEVDKQKQIMDGEEKWCKLMDATHVLTQNEFRRAVDYDHLRRRFDTLPVFYPQLEPVIEFINRNLVANIRKYRKKKLHGLV